MGGHVLLGGQRVCWCDSCEPVYFLAWVGGLFDVAYPMVLREDLTGIRGMLLVPSEGC